MNKLLTIFSVLLIVAYAHATKKVSYSEIVSSLAQVSHVEGADTIVETVAASYAESLKKLQVFNTALNNQCTGIAARASKKYENFQASIKSTISSINEIEGNSKELANEISQVQQDQVENQQNQEKLREQIKEGREKLQDQSIAIIERSRVLRRLSNLVQDELTGNQRVGTVDQFKVDNSRSGYSFVEVHNQLKELESRDAVTKSMISTLILITQDRNFANQENVGKIQALINQIIQKDAQRAEELRKNAADEAAIIQKSLSESSEAMMKNVSLIAEKRAQIAANLNVVRFSRAEQKDMEKHMARATVRKSSNLAACKKVQDMSKLQAGDFNNGRERFENLKKVLSE